MLSDFCSEFQEYKFMKNDLYKDALFGGTNVYLKIGLNGEKRLVTSKKYRKI